MRPLHHPHRPAVLPAPHRTLRLRLDRHLRLQDLDRVHHPRRLRDHRKGPARPQRQLPRREDVLRRQRLAELVHQHRVPVRDHLRQLPHRPDHPVLVVRLHERHPARPHPLRAPTASPPPSPSAATGDAGTLLHRLLHRLLLRVLPVLPRRHHDPRPLRRQVLVRRLQHERHRVRHCHPRVRQHDPRHQLVVRPLLQLVRARPRAPDRPPRRPVLRPPPPPQVEVRPVVPKPLRHRQRQEVPEVRHLLRGVVRPQERLPVLVHVDPPVHVHVHHVRVLLAHHPLQPRRAQAQVHAPRSLPPPLPQHHD
eukprot:Sspe_Gene.923::Locus_312_Transcript_1_1_Confidence_1.000_Length_2744::g.923::m.923